MWRYGDDEEKESGTGTSTIRRCGCGLGSPPPPHFSLGEPLPDVDHDETAMTPTAAMTPVLFCRFSCFLVYSVLSPNCRIRGAAAARRRIREVGPYYLCVFIFFSPTCRLWPRDNNEEDGGDDDYDARTSESRSIAVARTKAVRWLYNLSVGLFVFVSPKCMQAMAEGQRCVG